MIISTGMLLLIGAVALLGSLARDSRLPFGLALHFVVVTLLIGPPVATKDVTVATEQPPQYLPHPGPRAATTIAAVALALARDHCPEVATDSERLTEMAVSYASSLRLRMPDDAIGDVLTYATEIAHQVCDGVCVETAGMPPQACST